MIRDIIIEKLQKKIDVICEFDITVVEMHLKKLGVNIINRKIDRSDMVIIDKYFLKFPIQQFILEKMLLIGKIPESNFDAYFDKKQLFVINLLKLSGDYFSSEIVEGEETSYNSIFLSEYGIIDLLKFHMPDGYNKFISLVPKHFSNMDSDILLVIMKDYMILKYKEFHNDLLQNSYYFRKEYFSLDGFEAYQSNYKNIKK